MDNDAVCTKATSRLHFLEILQRSSLNSSDLFFYFYTAVIRPIREYACHAWHNSQQSRQIESVQKRALSIIFGHTRAHYDQYCCVLINNYQHYIITELN